MELTGKTRSGASGAVEHGRLHRPDADRGRPGPDSLTDEIVVRLEQAILQGVYPPGTRLLQEELCERFGVSRTPVRQALRDLQARNLVTLVANRGATVRTPSRGDASEAYALRAELEGYAAELAAGRCDGLSAMELRQAQDRIVQLVEPFQHFEQTASSVQVEVHHATGAFHKAIRNTAGNKRLAATVLQLEQSFPTEYVGYAIASSRESHALNVDEHQAIFDAISHGDRSAAREAMRSHVLHLGAAVIRYLDERGFWT